MVKDEKLKRRLRELVSQAEDEGKGGKDTEAIKKVLKVMGDEVENSEDMKEEEKMSWREQEKRIKKELQKAQDTAIHTASTKPDKTQGIMATPLKTKGDMELQEARWSQLTASTAEDIVAMHGLPPTACAIIEMLKATAEKIITQEDTTESNTAGSDEQRKVTAKIEKELYKTSVQVYGFHAEASYMSPTQRRAAIKDFWWNVDHISWKESKEQVDQMDWYAEGKKLATAALKLKNTYSVNRLLKNFNKKNGREHPYIHEALVQVSNKKGGYEEKWIKTELWITKIITTEEEQKRMIMKSVVKCITQMDDENKEANTAIKNYQTPWTIAKSDGTIVTVVNFDMPSLQVYVDVNK